MIQGLCEIFCTPGGAQGVPQDADIGGSEGANYNSEFCSFMVPIFEKQVGIAMKPHFVNIQSPVGTRAGAGRGADIKVEIYFPRKLQMLKGDKLVSDNIKFHNLANFNTNQLLGTKNHPLIPFSTISYTPGCFKSNFLNRKDKNLQKCFFVIYLHNQANCISQCSVQIIQIVAGHEKLSSQPIFQHF